METPDTIQIAAGDGKLQLVQELVAAGTNVNDQDEYGYSPLMAACSYGNAEVASWLVSQGAKVDITDSEGDTALSVCESAACADVLAAAGADIFHANNEGATAYHVAVWECREEMVTWLAAKYAAAGKELPEVGAAPDEDAGEDVNFNVVEMEEAQ